jgi:hypothetical protein
MLPNTTYLIGIFLQNFVAFPEYLNFTISNMYFLLQAAKREQESDQNADDNDAIQTEDESVHDKIKKAYNRSKHSYK